MNELEWFEQRLESAKTDGANFVVPINWARYGPLFLQLYKSATEALAAGLYGPEGFVVREAVTGIKEQMEWDLNR